MTRPPFPKSLSEFQAKFATEEACQQYLAACRWLMALFVLDPNFVCACVEEEGL